MGKVKTFSLAGIECWFNSQEHLPPHFHARKRGHWHVRVYFLKAAGAMVERARVGPKKRIMANDQHALEDVAELYRSELMAEWEQKVCYDN